MAGPACSRCWGLSSKHGATFQGLRSRLRSRRPGQTEKTECLEDAVTLTCSPCSQSTSSGLFTYHSLGLLSTWHRPVPGKHLTPY